MDKDASYLRCSKVSLHYDCVTKLPNVLDLPQLTCYAEFNRMVTAVAKHGTTAGYAILFSTFTINIS